ncbi:MAG: hypothetical protein U0231_11010 [Nitrospiraceae bacterium]
MPFPAGVVLALLIVLTAAIPASAESIRVLVGQDLHQLEVRSEGSWP